MHCALQPAPLPDVADPCARKKSFLQRQAPMLQGAMKEPL